MDEAGPAPSSYEVSGESVLAFHDGAFARVRELHEVPETFLAKFDFRTLRLFGGKGGNLMAFTEDRRFLVKELNKGDHASLLRHTPMLVERLLAPDTLLCQLLAHFVRGAKRYVAMRNVLPSARGLVWHRLYDLKGNRDDKLLEEDGDGLDEVHKRCYDCHKCWYGCDGLVPFCTTAGRKRYVMGKQHAYDTVFELGDVHAARLTRALRADASMLAAAGLMDYSLIVGVLLLKGAEQPPPTEPGLDAYVVEQGGRTYVYYVGIIDYLQEWTTAKVAAMWIKTAVAPKPMSTVPPPLYGQQFAESLGRKFKGGGSSVSVHGHAEPAARPTAGQLDARV
jgi:hypothetical protein